MKQILVCWIGAADLNASEKQESIGIGIGPIAQAVKEYDIDNIQIISDYSKKKVNNYIKWLKNRTSTNVNVTFENLSSPTHFGEIYTAAIKVIDQIQSKYGKNIDLIFHISPGTPAMAAVWIIIAKTRFPAKLIEASIESGVKKVSVPFDISADYIPDLLQNSDKKLVLHSSSVPPESPEFSEIIYRSDVMRRVIYKAKKVSYRSVPVIIEGESGTGKELLARAIHKEGLRKNQRFIAVNCGAIPSELVEAELFGYEKGAFTGATNTRKGYFETADKGTLFLDEVGELPLAAQVKILRVLQEGEIVRLGSSTPLKINIRIIAATNRILTEEIQAGNFREDLFYRLAVAIIKIPPLRERPGDLSLLINKLLDQVNKESIEEPGYYDKKFSASAKNLMLNHTWPGNVRELLNTIRRAAIWSGGDAIQAEDINDALIPSISKSESDILNIPLGQGFSLPELISKVAKHYLSKALEETNNNKSQAAKLIGLPNYQTFTNWMSKYKIEKNGIHIAKQC